MSPPNPRRTVCFARRRDEVASLVATTTVRRRKDTFLKVAQTLRSCSGAVLQTCTSQVVQAEISKDYGPSDTTVNCGNKLLGESFVCVDLPGIGSLGRPFRILDVQQNQGVRPCRTSLNTGLHIEFSASSCMTTGTSQGKESVPRKHVYSSDPIRDFRIQRTDQSTGSISTVGTAQL